MKETHRTHWLLERIAEERVAGASIDLWPGIAERAIQAPAVSRRSRLATPASRLAVGVALAALLVGSLLLVPGVWAFGETVLQRMGIALVDTTVQEEGMQSVALEVTIVPGEPSALTVEQVRGQIDFDVKLPTWLPQEFAHSRVSLTGDPMPDDDYGNKLGIHYSQVAAPGLGDGVLSMHASEGLLSAPPLLPQAAEQAVTVRGVSGAYVHGGWQDDGTGDPNIATGNLLWDAQADDAYLTWVEDGVTYLLEAHNLGLELGDLMKMAESLE